MAKIAWNCRSKEPINDVVRYNGRSDDLNVTWTILVKKMSQSYENELIAEKRNPWLDEPERMG